ncbi:hypothetical protein SAMN06265365_12335 [Tistlia consotensis]|uniref:Bbp19-like phage domain-containing protein n=1 Tax=Tistlia consotensis USBA 355 TaxID=560819 RepID=A0A1Y6CGY3_9PROT|nr:hypothetical protein [Tistlia consotensis]SMF64646.1 hypothetical protein SAMN05428998_12574 [Tistlia consotensis USBA 355]SNR97088.1 hypothetical protein SAMN06265365_12335 [Tistlia consotensis]
MTGAGHFDAGHFDAGEAAAVAERAKRMTREQQRRAAALRYVLEDRRGRDWLWSLLEDCRIWTSSYTGDTATFFNEGMRNVGLKVLTEITETVPEALVTMITENHSDERDDGDSGREPGREP